VLIDMAGKHYLVTGGTGFIGAALVLRLLKDGHKVRVLDNNSRGAVRRLGPAAANVEVLVGDVRDKDFVSHAVRGVDAVHHLAFVNGTENFYKHPDLVLEVGTKGMIHVVDACIEHGVGELIVASSSEVYQTPPKTPTDESAPLIVPDLVNPRYSYGGGKLFSELYAVHVASARLDRVLIYRPHNVYGPDMGWEHVIPQFAVRLRQLAEASPKGEIGFPIQGSGRETRSFCYIDDFINGLILVQDDGENRGLYHIGTREEATIADLARWMAARLGREIHLEPGPILAGSPMRRCPAIEKLEALGYQQKVSLSQGLALTCDWYFNNAKVTSNVA
jgi:nucleoside-diphosphate-sugar epimerase